MGLTEFIIMLNAAAQVIPPPDPGDITMGDEDVLWGDEDVTFED